MLDDINKLLDSLSKSKFRGSFHLNKKMCLYVGDKGILGKTKKTTANANGAASGDMVWQVVKLYTMPDGQKGAKLMRIA